MATVFDRVKTVIVDRLGTEEDQIKPEASFVDDLHADSLDLVELIMAFEEEFSDDTTTVKISDEDAENIRTIQDAVTFVKNQGVQDS